MTLVMERNKENEEITIINSSLDEQFKNLQTEMVSRGMDLGLQHPDVLEISQKLDVVHNKMLKVGIYHD